MKSINSGFTLIELMIVTAIIGILASVALPSYQTYVTRAQVTEALVIVGELKAAVVEHYKETGRFPTDNAAAGIPKAEFLLGNYVKGIELADGAFHIRFGNKVHNVLSDKILTVRPITVTGSPTSPMSWLCGHGTVPQGMQAVGENKTDADTTLLPSSCRT